MVRVKIIWIILILAGLSCRAQEAFRPPVQPVISPAAPAELSTPHLPYLTETAPAATQSDRIIPTMLSSPELAGDFTIRFHPDGGLFVGDLVSIEVIAPEASDLRDATLYFQAGEQKLGPFEFGHFGISGRQQATLLWAWDTAGLQPGWQMLTFSLQPQGLIWQEAVYIGPKENLPAAELEARWDSAETNCCTLHYITGTDAERDILDLITMADEAARLASSRMQAEFQKNASIILLPRVLGHGGFASDEIAISYLDQNYAGGSQSVVLLHEMIHLLDSQLGGEYRPSMLVEGLAVYLSGGHYRLEALPPRAAALLKIDGYIPLRELANNFYPSQHESGYLLAGALVQYMVEQWSWENYSAFYRDIRPPKNSDGPADVIDTALLKHFGVDLKSLEKEFLSYLGSVPVLPGDRDDVRLTLLYYDTLRLYQSLLDPSAYYQTAWLPDSKRMRQSGIVADYLRRPLGYRNELVETILVKASLHLQNRSYPEAEQLLHMAVQLLAIFEKPARIKVEAQ